MLQGSSRPPERANPSVSSARPCPGFKWTNCAPAKTRPNLYTNASRSKCQRVSCPKFARKWLTARRAGMGHQRRSQACARFVYPFPRSARMPGQQKELAEHEERLHERLQKIRAQEAAKAKAQHVRKKQVCSPAPPHRLPDSHEENTPCKGPGSRGRRRLRARGSRAGRSSG
jgi:hypothetical protein